jgi:hypothetical protein
VHVRIAFDTGTDLFSVWVNGLLKTSNQAMTATADVKRVQYSTGTVANTAFQNYLDAVDISSDPLYFTERSTYLFLNQTQTFPQPGSYSFRYQAWGGNVNYDQPWTPFVVVNNVQLISESTATTRWVLTSTATTTTWSSLYTDNFATNTGWVLTTPASGTWIDFPVTVTSAAYVYKLNPTTNYGTSTVLNVRNDLPVHTYDQWSYVQKPVASSSSYLIESLSTTQDFSINGFATSGSNVEVYGTTIFDESTVTWNTKPAAGASLGTFVPSFGSPQWRTMSTIAFSDYILLCGTGANAISGVFSSDDASSNKPFFTYYTNKSSYAAGHFYIQTDATESLTLNSPTFSTLNLQANDRVRVTFSTTSAHQINLLTNNGGTTVTTRELVAEGNTNFDSQTRTFTLTGAETLTGLNLTGTFDDTKNLQVTGITIERPVVSGASPVQTYIDPDGQYHISITPYNYTLDIYEGSQLKWSTNTTITFYILNTFTYSPTTGGERQVNIYDSQNKLLDFALFRTVLNRTLNGINSPVNPDSPYFMANNRFYADVVSYYNLTVADRFGQSLVNRTNFAIATFIDITILSIYSLKIQNRMTYSSIVTLTRLGTSYSQYLASEEIAEYQLYAGIYELNYTNNELGTAISVNLTIASAMLYTLNSSYRHIYISAYSLDAPDIPLDSFRLFIDGTQYFWGWNYLFDGSYAVVVKDWFDANVYAAMRSISDDSPINLPLSIYSLKIQNLMRTDTYISLNSPGGYLDKYLLAGTEAELFLGGGTYQLLYTQTETMTPITYNFVLAGAMRYVMNTSYRSIYFSAFSNDGQGVPTDSVRLYVDYFRQSWGPVEILGPNHNVTVLDYFNDIVYSQVLDLSAYSEFNVFVNIAWMSLYNNNTQDYYTFSIVKNNTMLLTQAIAPQNFLLFRFTTGTYNVTAFYQNGSLFESHNITLAENSSNLLSFGVIAPDFTSVYASQLYNYALFRNLIPWSPNLPDDYAMFYAVQIVNYLNETGTVYFEYLGTVMPITVSASQAYTQPLYVPKGATYRLYANVSGYLGDWTPLATNETADGYATLNFGFYSEKVLVNAIQPSVVDIYVFVFAILGISAIVLVVLYVNAKRKLARDESRGERARNRAGVSRQIR